MVGVLGSCKIGFAPGNLYLAFRADLGFGICNLFIIIMNQCHIHALRQNKSWKK